MSDIPARPTSHLPTKTQHGPLEREGDVQPRDTYQPSRRSPVFSPMPEHIPLWRKSRQEKHIISELRSALGAKDHTDLTAFGHGLAPIVRAVIAQELPAEHPGRSSFHYEIATTTCAFLDEQYERYYATSSLSFFSVLVEAGESDTSKHLELVLYVLAELFVLTGPYIFMRIDVLRLLIEILGLIPRRQSNILNMLRMATCRCLVWSFSRMVDWELIGDRLWEESVEILDLHILAEDVEELVAYLIDTRRPTKSTECDFPGVRLASMVVDTLAGRQHDFSRTFAFIILRHLLLGGPKDAIAGLCRNNISLECFSHIDAVMRRDYTFEERPEPSSGPTTLRVLSTLEVQAAWQSLTALWDDFVLEDVDTAIQKFRYLDVMVLSDDMLQMWRVLQRAAGQDPSNLESMCNVYASLTDLLDKEEYDSQQLLKASMSIHSIQAASQLWSVTADELDIVSRSDVSQKILRRMFEYRDYHETFIGPTEKAYNSFVTQLVICSPQHALSAIAETRYETFCKLQTWCDLVHYTVLPDIAAAAVTGKCNFNVDDLVAFLNFPDKYSLRDEHSYSDQLWNKLLNRTFAIAADRGEVALVLQLMDKQPKRLKIERGKRKRDIDEMSAGDSEGELVEGSGGLKRHKRTVESTEGTNEY